MENREGKEKGEGGPQAVGPIKKYRRVEGPVGVALNDLVSLLGVFASDLTEPEVPVEEAAKYMRDNLELWCSRHAPRR